MKRATLNLHVSEAAHAWLRAHCQIHGLTMSEAIRNMLREQMGREMAEAGIAAGMRCHWQDCLARPVAEGACEEHRPRGETKRAKRKES